MVGSKNGLHQLQFLVSAQGLVKSGARGKTGLAIAGMAIKSKKRKGI